VADSRADFLAQRLDDCLEDRQRYFEQYLEVRELVFAAEERAAEDAAVRRDRPGPRGAAAGPTPGDLFRALPDAPDARDRDGPKGKDWKKFWKWIQEAPPPKPAAPSREEDPGLLAQLLAKEQASRAEERQALAQRVSYWREEHYNLTCKVAGLEEQVAKLKAELKARRALDPLLLARLRGDKLGQRTPPSVSGASTPVPPSAPESEGAGGSEVESEGNGIGAARALTRPVNRTATRPVSRGEMI